MLFVTPFSLLILSAPFEVAEALFERSSASLESSWLPLPLSQAMRIRGCLICVRGFRPVDQREFLLIVSFVNTKLAWQKAHVMANLSPGFQGRRTKHEPHRMNINLAAHATCTFGLFDCILLYEVRPQEQKAEFRLDHYLW